MSFNPKSEYIVTPTTIPIEEFHLYADDYVIRPPYQRKSVWGTKKKQALLDSIFRRYYIPKIVIREVRLDNERTANEIVDGQQRIDTVQEFCSDKIKLPDTLNDIHPDIVGKYYSELSTDIKRFINKELRYSADIVKGIEDPKNSVHQRIAAEIFWRLQNGEPLNFMEKAHSRLSSLVRNFVVKYADDITFDFDAYKPVEGNAQKHKFFKLYTRDNDRMQHLLLMARLLMLEKAGGPTELKDAAVAELIEASIVPDGVGNDSLENTPEAKALLSNLTELYNIFKNDPMLDDKSGLKELTREYVVISFYLLLRHLKNLYVVNDSVRQLYHDFLITEFFPRWSKPDDEDNDVFFFSTNRQMDKNSIEDRNQILRQMFFEFAIKRGVEIIAKDDNRGFNEAQRIAIYRKDKGLCQQCLAESKPEKEAQVSWSEYEADHILAHSKGGVTDETNAQVLCRPHNRLKSSK